MRSFFVYQDTVKGLAKDLRTTFGPAIKHRAMIRLICTALGWRDDVLMHNLKKFADAGVLPTPTIAVPKNFALVLSKALSSGYGKQISRQEVENSIMFPIPTYETKEAIFGEVARLMVDRGWSVFPQELSRARPARVNGSIIRWKETHDLANKLPDAQVLDHWIDNCRDMNVGLVMGPASDNVIMLDIDVSDHDLGEQIKDLAAFHLGLTPLRRVGTFPQMTLIYRQSTADMLSAQCVQFKQTSNDGTVGRNEGVDLTTDGAATLYGKHLKTGRYFTWLHDSPADVGPKECPVVSSKQMAEFFKAVSSLHELAEKPPVNLYWSVNEDGLVDDGRESYLGSLVARQASKLEDISHLLSAEAGEQLTELAKAIAAEFTRTAVSSPRWTGQSLQDETLRRLRLAVARIGKK
jgi:hypothetical protein